MATEITMPRTVRLAASPVVSAAPAYSTGDCMGGLMTLTGAPLCGTIQDVTINCKSAQTFAADLIFYRGNPSATTFTDNAAMALNAADWDKVLFHASITAWSSLGTPSVATAINLGLAYTLAGALPTSDQSILFANLIVRGTPTLGSTSDIQVVVRVVPNVYAL